MYQGQGNQTLSTNDNNREHNLFWKTLLVPIIVQDILFLYHNNI